MNELKHPHQTIPKVKREEELSSVVMWIESHEMYDNDELWGNGIL
jgi:hypothetical protein